LIAVIAAASLAVGAVGGVVVATALDDDEAEASRVDSPLAVYARTSFDPTPGPGDTTDTTATDTTTTDTTTETTDTETTTDTTTTPTDTPAPTDDPPADLVALQARVPATDQPCRYEVLEGFEDLVLICAGQGVVSVYETYKGANQLRAVYADVVRDAEATGTLGTSCPDALPSDQEIVRGGVTTGRLLCLEYEGRPFLAWTSEPLRTLVVAFGATGSPMSDLYAWWEQAPRPALTDDELAFYAAIPEDQRASCDFVWAGLSDTRSRAARCVAPSPLDPAMSIELGYAQWANADELSSDYADGLELFGISRDSGRCPGEPPGEGVWQQSGRTAGRVGCAALEFPVLVWTTDALTIKSAALALGMDLDELWTWWTGQPGRLYPKG
jgi:hypothetical protein